MKMELNKIYNEDCLDTMARMPDEVVDLIFADPPFNIGKKYSEGINDNRKDYFKWCDEWIEECFRILKPTGSVFIMNLSKNTTKLQTILDKYGIWRNTIIWKNNGSGASKKAFWTFYQPIFFYSKTDEYKFNTYAETTIEYRWSPRPQKGQLGDIWDHIPFIYAGSIIHKEAILKRGTKAKAHPCQMPLKIVKRPIIFCTNENDIVYDPFMGSGTTAIAALQLNRNYIGSEMSKEYCDIATKRIAQHKAQLTLNL